MTNLKTTYMENLDKLNYRINTLYSYGKIGDEKIQLINNDIKRNPSMVVEWFKMLENAWNLRTD